MSNYLPEFCPKAVDVRLAGFDEHEQFAVFVWRSVREDGETKTELSRRSLELPRVAVQALMEWLLAQADERLAAGTRWHDTDLVFTYHYRH